MDLLKKHKIWFLWCLFLTITSCQRIIDNYWEKQALENYASPYQGNYDGIYTGDISGKFTLQVGKDGNIFGLRDDVDNFGGKVYEGGALLSVESPYSGFQLIGSLESKSGTWKVGNYTGTWTTTKK